MKDHTYHIVTYGCQMNKNDSQRLESILAGMGLVPALTIIEADVIILTSCSVRESAESRIFGQTNNFLALKEKNPEVIIAVTGCMPGRDKDGAMKKKLSGVDLYFPTKDMVNLPLWLSQLNPALRPMEDPEKDYLSIRPTYRRAFQAFATLQTGCNHFCTYCVVPYARGLEVNRPVADILAEIRDLVHRGCREVTLLGQIVNHYLAPQPEQFSTANPYAKNHFAKLLWEINQISGLERVHWTAPHPLYMDDEAIDALTLPKQVNYIHLPAQSGNTEVLRRMNRRHTREQYLDIIQKIRSKKPSLAIGTDIIVGFCGETAAQFMDTVSLYRLADFDISYHAQYSSRSGTLAEKIFSDDVPREEKKRRWDALQELMEETTYRKNQAYLDGEVSVLVDERRGEWLEGNSREMKRVRFKGSTDLVGTIQQIRIFKADTWMLWGNLVGQS
ncbi:MAG: tRNA (N6-isopentenyl adenosine(37)-C2)-methylthiotransferase MiaB [Candidatus Magasanikbacteria bacterium]|nr:tRNA (N6-isopentenyl adenosine(37)-C2)-methylthiotransferase MiaB [Candidatus Magasanikbacteria bacterium]